jgi:hypothetical protein
MGQTPEEIRLEIEQTRARMTDTVGAIGYRTDVKTRAKEAVMERTNALLGAKDTVVGGVRRTAGRLTAPLPGPGDAAGAIGDAVPDRQHVRQVVSVAQSNPVGLALGATALGFLIGLAAPTTNTENEKLGPISDRLKEQASEVGQQALEHGKAVAQEAASAAGEAIQEAGTEHGAELADSLRDGARAVAAGE